MFDLLLVSPVLLQNVRKIVLNPVLRLTTWSVPQHGVATNSIREPVIPRGRGALQSLDPSFWVLPGWGSGNLVCQTSYWKWKLVCPCCQNDALWCMVEKTSSFAKLSPETCDHFLYRMRKMWKFLFSPIFFSESKITVNK